MEFNQKEYIKNYNKENYSTFKVDLKKEEKEELDDLFKKLNIKKSDFLRKSIENFKEEIKMKKYYVKTGTFNCVKKGNHWYFKGDVTCDHNDLEKIFNTIEEARECYDGIKLKDDIQIDSRYSDYKELYEIDGSINDIDDVDLDKARFIADDYIFTDYE